MERNIRRNTLDGRLLWAQVRIITVVTHRGKNGAFGASLQHELVSNEDYTQSGAGGGGGGRLLTLKEISDDSS